MSRKKPTVFLKAGLSAPVVDPLEDSANAGVTVNYIYDTGVIRFLRFQVLNYK